MSDLFGRSLLRRWITVGAIALFASAGPATAQQPRARLDTAVESAIAHGEGPARVIVRVSARDRAALKNTLATRGHSVKREHALMSALTVELP
ncbi:MAG: hypothetical protein ACRDF6_11185, partial [bacterium]